MYKLRRISNGKFFCIEKDYIAFHAEDNMENNFNTIDEAIDYLGFTYGYVTNFDVCDIELYYKTDQKEINIVMPIYWKLDEIINWPTFDV